HGPERGRRRQAEHAVEARDQLLQEQGLHGFDGTRFGMRGGIARLFAPGEETLDFDIVAAVDECIAADVDVAGEYGDLVLLDTVPRHIAGGVHDESDSHEMILGRTRSTMVVTSV